jgi:hypothetical protein
VGLGICLVVVDDFDTVGTSCRPDEADAPLSIDADAVLPGAVAFQGVQLVLWRHGRSCSTLALFSIRNFRSAVGWMSCGEARLNSPPQMRSVFPIAKSDDHAGS